MGRTTSALNFSGHKNFSRYEHETEKIDRNENMTRTIGFINPVGRNKRYSANNSILNNVYNYNTSNISLISFNDFNNIKSGFQLNKSFKSRTTKHKYRNLINLRPPSIETKINIDKMNFFKKPDVPRNLDVLNLILKHSPEKIDMKLVAQKMNILNKEIKDKSLNSTVKKFYDYNVIYGYKSNNIIKSYTPKLILKKPGKAKKVTKNGLEIQQIFNNSDISALFNQKCIDLNIPLKEELLNRFTDFIKLKCVNRVIDLTDCKLGLSSMLVLSEILINNNDNFSRLILSKNNFGDKGIEILLDSISDNNSILELNLSSNSISPRGGKLIFEYLLNQNSIISLDLSSEDGINRNRICAEGVKPLEEVLQTNFFIENLDISSNSIKNEGFKYLINGLKGNEVMKKLNVSNNEIDEKGIFYLKENLKNCKVEMLDLSFNPIGNEGCIAISKCLIAEKLSEINYINLSECNIKFNGVKEFFKYMKNNKKLDTILFNRNNLFSRKWIYLEEFLFNLNLKHLGLNSCSLNVAVEDISKIIIHHPTLKILELSHNQINDDSFSFFKSFPKENLTLIELDFSRNYISDRSAKYFFAKLYNNKSLQKLNFFDNQLQNDSANAIIESLKENHSLIYINLKSNRIPIRIMNEINYRIQTNKLKERGNFLPKLKREIKDLSFEPNEINVLKGRIIMQDNEKKLSVKKLKEDNKIIKLKKTETEKELNIIESQSDDLLLKLKELNESINNEIELKENEMNDFNKQCEKLQKNIVNLLAEVENLNSQNEALKEKYNDVNKKFKKSYNTTLKKFENKRKFLQIIIEQLNYKKKKFSLNQRVLDRLKNPEKFNPLNEKEIVKSNKSEDVTKRLNKIKSENNIAAKNLDEMSILKKEPKTSSSKRSKSKKGIINLKKA